MAILTPPPTIPKHCPITTYSLSMGEKKESMLSVLTKETGEYWKLGLTIVAVVEDLLSETPLVL